MIEQTEKDDLVPVSEEDQHIVEHAPREHPDVVEEVARRAGITPEQASELVARHGADDIGRLLNYAKHLIGPE